MRWTDSPTWNTFCSVLSEVGRTRLRRARTDVHVCHLPAGWVSVSLPHCHHHTSEWAWHLEPTVAPDWLRSLTNKLTQISEKFHLRWPIINIREGNATLMEITSCVPVLYWTLPVWSWAWSSAHPSSLRGVSAWNATTRATCSDSCRRRSKSSVSSSPSGATATTSSLPGRPFMSTRRRSMTMPALGQ